MSTTLSDKKFTNAQVAKYVFGWETETQKRHIHSADPGPYYKETGGSIVVSRWEDDIGPTAEYTDFFEEAKFDHMVLAHVNNRWTKRMKVAFGFWLTMILEKRVKPDSDLSDQTFACLLEYQIGDYAQAAMIAVEKEKGLK